MNSETVVNTLEASATRYRGLVEASSRVAGLPAVATLDWCDAAAATLTSLVPGSFSLVLIANLSPDGRISGHEAGGSAHAGATTNLRMRHLLSGLRAGADHMRELGWTPHPEMTSRGQVGLASALAGPSWREGLIGHTWQPAEANDVVCAAYPLDPGRSGRALITHLTTTRGFAETPPENEDLVAQLASLVPQLAERVLLALGETPSTSGRWLTAREQQVLEELTLGKSVRDIAEVLGRSPHTVHDHVKSLHRKLGASSRGELISRALGHLAGESRLPEAPMVMSISGSPALDFEPKLAQRARAIPTESISTQGASYRGQ
ncbi:MAG: LuxR C-terminal-related transcriptional regulator [Planctomycetota bacterium]